MTNVERLAAALLRASGQFSPHDGPGDVARLIIDADPTLAQDAEDGAELRALREALPDGWAASIRLLGSGADVWAWHEHLPIESITRGGPTIAAAARAAREALEERR